MSGDNASSRDSAVIDDDLVEALGFEPMALDSGDVDVETASNDSGTVLDRTKPNDDAVDAKNVDEEVDDTASLDDDPVEVDDSGKIDSAKSGVVILGDVTPVDADDPVAGAIAAAVLDDLDVSDSQESNDHSSAGSFFGERSTSDDDAVEIASPDDETKLDSLTSDTRVESESATSIEVPLIESAFPEVPVLDDAGQADSELDDRELFTQPVEISDDLVQDLDVPLLEPAVEEDDEEQPVLEPQPAAVGVAPARSGYRRKRVRARKTRRVIRHIDPWSVLTFSILFHLAMYTAFLLASVLVWKTLESSGMVENIEDFIIALGDYETYEINADVLFRAGVIIAGILTVASTILSVLLCVVFNLISDLVGGIRVTVLEEETVRLAPRKKRDKTK